MENSTLFCFLRQVSRAGRPETYYYVPQAGLGLTFSCLSLPDAGVPGMCHHTQPNTVYQSIKQVVCDARLKNTN